MRDPWDDIPRASTPGARTARLADAEHPLDFHRGRDFEGRHLFWLECDATGSLPADLPRIGGIDIELHAPASGRWFFGLALRDGEQLEIFRPLCANLMAATASLSPREGEKAVLVVLGRLKRWQDLLKRRNDDLLGRNEIIGLVGELLFLRDRVLDRLGEVEATLSWRGPFGDEQDFVVARGIIELKTQLATADRRFQITTEDQLDTASGPIALCHQALGQGARGQAGAFSLNALVAELLARLEQTFGDAADILRGSLLEAGYRERPEYDVDWWVPGEFRVYEVAPGFPRITATSLPPGVSRVRYDISIAACAEFERTRAWLAEFILDAA